MQFYRSLESVSAAQPSVVTIGNFDGIHLGHQTLIRQAISASQSDGAATWLVSFDPHPLEYFKQAKQIRLMSWREKYEAIQAQGIDNFLALPFDQQIASMTADDFIQHILIDVLHAHTVVVGDDFRFGKGRTGDANLLRTMGEATGFNVIEMPTFTLQDERVSTSRIRAAIDVGDLPLAQQLLGQPYTLSGRVTYGDQIGRTLGFPTINLCLRRRLVALSGVYAVWVRVNGQSLPGACHVGPRPVVGEMQPVCEVHLIDFDGDLYGQRVDVQFIQKIRDVQNFDSLDALTRQMQQDIVEVTHQLR